MSTHDDYLTRRQARDLARRLARLERKQRSTAAAHADLRHSAIDGGKGLVLKDEQGQEKYRLGTDENGVTAPQYKGGPVPAQPSEPFVDVGGEVVKIQHSGLDVNEDPAPADFRRAQIHVSQDEVFEPDFSTLAGYMDAADGSFTHRLPGGEWHVGIVWETLTGKQSAMSATVLADIPPLVDTSDLEDTLAAAEEKLNEYRDEVAAPRFQALEEGLSENNDTLANARERLDEAEQILDPLPDRVTEAEQTAQTAQQEATAAAAAAIEANNRALTRLYNGNFDHELDGWSVDNVTISEDSHSGLYAARLETQSWMWADTALPVRPGQIWELSMFTKADADRLGIDVWVEDEYGEYLDTFQRFTLDPTGAWSDSGGLRFEIPEGAGFLNFTITPWKQVASVWLVDDIVLRDVTDVVRLEEAANANRQKAEEAARMAEITRELTGMDEHVHVSEEQPDAPPAGQPGITYAWEGTPHASPSVKRVDGELVARNRFKNPSFEVDLSGITSSPTATLTRAGNLAVASGEWGLQVEISDSTEFGGWIHQSIDVTPDDWGHWVGWSAAVRNSINVSQLRWYYEVRQGSTVLSGDYAGTFDVTSDSLEDSPREVFAAQIDEGADNVRLWLRPVTSHAYARYFTDDWIAAVGDSEQAALDEVATYFDGDTPDHPAVPATGGIWVNPANDQRRVYNHETGNWDLVTERGLFEAIVAKQATIINAAMQTLTVTERLDFARAYGEEIWAALAVFDRLQAAEGWIGGVMLKDDTITARNIEITERLVGDLAELLHLVVDRIDANQLWADQTWQAAGHFGSEEADQSTLVDGTGLRITKHDHENETSTDIVRLGGEGIGLTFTDEETKEITGSLSPDGDASLKNVNVNHLTMGGRSLQDEECDDYYHPSGDQSLLTFRPRGVEAFHHRHMPAMNSDYREWGFLDVTATLYAGRMYRVSVGPVYTFADNTTNQLRIRYTDDGTVARIISPILGRARYGTQAGQHSSHISGEWYFTPDHTGQHSFLATIYNGQGVRLPTGYTGDDGNCWLVVEDIGLAPPNRTGQDRDTRGNHKDSGINNEDTVGGIETYTTTWEATWYQTYRNNGNTPVPAGDGFGENSPIQGYRALVGEYYNSLFGFGGATDSSNTTELGQTFQAALAGATVRSVVLEMTGHYSGGQTGDTVYRLIRENHTSPPNAYTYVVSENRRIDDYRIDVGQTRRITLPAPDYGERFRNGELTAFGLSAIGNPDTRYHGGIAWANPALRPRITITYQR